MYFVDTFQAYLHVLQGVDEIHQLLDGRVQLPDDVLHRQHHTQGHLPVYHGGCRHYGNHDILYLIDEDAACLLGLLQFQALHICIEQFGLHVLPLPAAALFAVLQLYLLHGGDELVGLVVVLGLLLEVEVVYLLPAFQEEGNPSGVGDAACQKNAEYRQIVA